MTFALTEVTELLNDYLKGLISEYADDALDLETTRRVADFIDGNEEAEAYLHRLQRLRKVTAECLCDQPEDFTLDLRMMNVLRLRSYERTWMERLAETRILSPRTAAAAAMAVLVFVIIAFGLMQSPVSSFFDRTKAKVEQLGTEAQTDLGERTRDWAQSLGEMFAPPSDDEAGSDKTSSVLPRNEEVCPL